MKRILLMLTIAVSLHNVIFTQYDPNKPLNTQTYEFPKQSDLNANMNLMNLKYTMLFYKYLLPSINHQGKEIFYVMEKTTEQLYRLSYKRTTKSISEKELQKLDTLCNKFWDLEEELDYLLDETIDENQLKKIKKSFLATLNQASLKEYKLLKQYEETGIAQ